MRYFILAAVVAIAQLGFSSLAPVSDHGTGLDNRPELEGPLPVRLNAIKNNGAENNASTNHKITLQKRGAGFGIYFNFVKKYLWYDMPWSPGPGEEEPPQ